MAELREVQQLLTMLHQMVDEAKNAPFNGDKCMISRDEALDLLDEITAALPLELKRAQELLRAREDYVEAAKRDVERMMRQAEMECKAKVSESEVLAAARRRPFPLPCRRCRPPAAASAPPARKKCRPTAKSWPLPWRKKQNKTEKYRFKGDAPASMSLS